ncbi:hypothetical protein Vretimale_9916 [Volvox reticuliferus]|uniref:Uncharacterized protein n=1 Tax=Volvox reticuliferus TaxID=1737510 RepID=A0A8J4FT89_9CHLO|nr:hypothetical protein Vretifemale_13667 [Volvox reticuliferus]GIM05411.1 hypothetical protein Vretimale_9916 [Volvox reticuliferus]
MNSMRSKKCCQRSAMAIIANLALLGVILTSAPNLVQSLELSGMAGAGSLRRNRGRPHHYALFTEKAPCAILERRYFSSPLEQKWLQATAKWKENGNGDVGDITPYCTLLTETKAEIQRMLALIDVLMKSNTSLSDAPDADAVLSYFKTTMQCGPYRFTHKEHIESLVAALRHPFSIKCPEETFNQLPPRTDIFDKGYVLLASWVGPVQAARNKYYLDAGAGIGYIANSNQHWMLETYEARGISMDRALYWEAQAAPGPNLLAGVPPHMFPAFAFYNIPAPQELTDGRNPLNVIAKIAKPEDFVSIKLDIDHPGIEDIWLRAILGNNSTPVTAGVAKSVYAQLIDELFWEHHFNFMPMRTCCWQGLVDFDSHLVDSIKRFIELRELGIRSHYWQ